MGLGASAATKLWADEAGATDPLAVRAPHFWARAKKVIFLFMTGAPSHLELFDHKPELADGKLPPAELLDGYRAVFINPNSKLLGPKFKFARHGQCDAEISELLPETAKVVDDLAIVKSMHTDAFSNEREISVGYLLPGTGPSGAPHKRYPTLISRPILTGVEPEKASFAKNCLLARRLVERGVRFVQLFHEAWDQHGNLVGGLKKDCADTDRACAALVADLKARGLLDETLVIWGGEFGRTPMVQGGGNDGRDHHLNAFTMRMAGGGIRGGVTVGASDELGFNVVEDGVPVRDFHATILHLLGFDHRKLTKRVQGLDQRLTGVEEAHVVGELLA